MKSIYPCSVNREDGKMWLTPSERKNAKFPSNHSFSLDSDPAHADYLVLRTSLPNRFFLKKCDFFQVFGVTYEEFREEKNKRIKELASALVKVMKENAGN